jgi:hypothetical protein
MDCFWIFQPRANTESCEGWKRVLKDVLNGLWTCCIGADFLKEIETEILAVIGEELIVRVLPNDSSAFGQLRDSKTIATFDRDFLICKVRASNEFR